MSSSPNPDAVGAKKSVKVCVLGSVAAGKTCFLAGLEILAEANRDVSIQVHAKGATKRRLLELAETLRRREWPTATSVVEVFELRVAYGDSMIDLVIVDYPGEDFSQHLRMLESEQIATLYHFYETADVLLLLLDPDLDVRGFDQLGSEQKEQRLRRQDAHMQAVREAWGQSAGAKSSVRKPKVVDVGVVVTKCDRLPELKSQADVRRFLNQYAGPMLDKLRRQSADLQTFPLSAVGGTEPDGEEPKPRLIPVADLHPTGYEQILSWIIQRQLWRANSKKRRALYLGIAAVSLLACLICIHQVWQCISFWQIADSSNRSLAEKIIETSTILPLVDCGTGARRTELYDQLVAELEAKINGAPSIDALLEMRQVIKRILELRPARRTNDFESLRQRCDKLRQNSRFETVRIQYEQSKATFPEVAGHFLEDFPQSENASIVRSWLAIWKDKKRIEDRALIKSITIENSTSLRRKAAAIDDYLKNWPSKDENDNAIRRAAVLAQMFSEKRPYKVTLKRSGVFNQPRRHFVLLKVGDEQLPGRDSVDKATIFNWENTRFDIQWVAGEPVDLALKSENWRWAWDEVAKRTDKSPLAISMLLQKTSLIPLTAWVGDVVEPFVEFEIEGITKEDLAIIGDYLLPGDKW